MESEMFDISKVMKVYSGKKGCMCGCLGTYKVASAHVDAANADRGYAYDAEDISDRSVKLIISKIESALRKGFADKDSFTDTYVAVDVTSDTGSVRTYAMYFVPASK
jgi:hypothetical protein